MRSWKFGDSEKYKTADSEDWRGLGADTRDIYWFIKEGEGANRRRVALSIDLSNNAHSDNLDN